MAEREKLKIPYPVIVEGRYDKARLSGVIEAEILTTAGFGIFSKKTHFRIFTRLVPLKSFFYKCLSLWVDVVFARNENKCFYVLFLKVFVR